jgi:hypothetical protein
MSCSEHSVRYHKQQTDRAISQAYSRLAADAPSAAKFHELLHCVRNRAARFWEAPVLNGHHPGVEALVHLSRFKSAHVRLAAEWPGTASSWRLAVSSLAQYLVGKYPVPLFLASCWYSTDGAAAVNQRGWFVAHARGASFRSLPLPIVMTRKMEHIFLASKDHLEIEPAMRRAELLALGAPAEVVGAVLSTRLAKDLNNGMFWRTFWHFLIANAEAIDPAQIGPLIDFIQALRHDRVTLETPDGMVQMDPPQPAFSVKGRSAQSMLRLMEDWHRSLGGGSTSLVWTRSALKPLLLEEPSPEASAPPIHWQMMELTNSAQLRIEGAVLRHCVASYADRCCQGASSIWSLRLRRGEKVRHVMTVEIDPNRRAVIQARGYANRAPSGRPLQLLQYWAARERLQMAM